MDHLQRKFKAANNTKDLIGISIQEMLLLFASMQEVLDAIENVNGMIGKSAENNQTQNQNIEQIKLGIEEISKAVESEFCICRGDFHNIRGVGCTGCNTRSSCQAF